MPHRSDQAARPDRSGLAESNGAAQLEDEEALSSPSAEPARPGDEGADGTGDGTGSPPSGRRRVAVWIASGLIAAGVLVGLAILLSRHGEGPRTGGSTTPTPSLSTPARVPFAFSLGSVTETSYNGRSAPKAARRAAERIRTLLGGWYDTAFANPAEWTKGVPGSAWSVFAPDVAEQARKDAGGLTLGKVAGLASLVADRSRLSVNVLLDPSLNPMAAVATVTFRATGTLDNGDLLEVTSSAKLLFRFQGGRWLIVGYPQATTSLRETPAPSPTPVAGPSGSGSVTP